MQEELTREFNRIKKEMILSFAKNSISSFNDYNEDKDYIADAILYSWFTSFANINDFNTRYEAFMKLDKLIAKSHLFELVEEIVKKTPRDHEEIKQALQVYKTLVEDEEYLKAIANSGYSLPSDFSKEVCYHNDSLLKRIEFYYTFKDKFENANQRIYSKKGVKK